MSHLFLSGGGGRKDSRLLDRAFAKKVKKGKRILYIPIAMPEKQHTFGSCFEWIRGTLKPFGITKIDMWTDLSGRNYKALKQYDAVYIGGGNTFYLLKTIRDSGFDKLLLRYLKDGGVYYGGSAGAIITGKDIGTSYVGGASDKNIVGLKNLRGLNLVNGYSIVCHYAEKYDKGAKSYIKRYRANMLCLPEETGLYVSDGKIKVMGTKKVAVFTRSGKRILGKGA